VRIDLRLLDAALRAGLSVLAENVIDGRVFDAIGNPDEHHALKEQPSHAMRRWPVEFDRIPATAMRHWFRRRKPGKVPRRAQRLSGSGDFRSIATGNLGGDRRRRDGRRLWVASSTPTAAVVAKWMLPSGIEPIEREHWSLVGMPGG
jgi:hypothetical protein